MNDTPITYFITIPTKEWIRTPRGHLARDVRALLSGRQARFRVSGGNAVIYSRDKSVIDDAWELCKTSVAHGAERSEMGFEDTAKLFKKWQVDRALNFAQRANISDRRTGAQKVRDVMNQRRPMDMDKINETRFEMWLKSHARVSDEKQFDLARSVCLTAKQVHQFHLDWYSNDGVLFQALDDVYVIEFTGRNAIGDCNTFQRVLGTAMGQYCYRGVRCTTDAARMLINLAERDRAMIAMTLLATEEEAYRHRPWFTPMPALKPTTANGGKSVMNVVCDSMMKTKGMDAVIGTEDHSYPPAVHVAHRRTMEAIPARQQFNNDAKRIFSQEKFNRDVMMSLWSEQDRQMYMLSKGKK